MMKKIPFLLLLLASCQLFSQVDKRDMKLEKKIFRLIEGFHGKIGVYVRDLKTGKAVSINADTVFPTASIVKVPIMMGIMNKINNSELSYHQKLSWADTIKYDAGEDIIPYMKPGSPIELSKVLMLMMTISDNNASLMLQGLAGTGTMINRFLDSLGYTHTRVNSRTPGREASRSVYGWGQTTPREMAKIMDDLTHGRIFNNELTDRAIRIMGRQYWDEEALTSIPPDIFVASKNGAVNASRSEVLFVKGRHPYILSLFTKENTDKSWEADNEAWQLTRKISAAVWEHLGK